MKRRQGTTAPAVNECPQCTTPTRCGRTGDSKRGPRCVGRADGPDDCDCLNQCGDDPWLAKNKATPCERRRQETAAAEFRATAGPAEYASWFPISPHGVQESSAFYLATHDEVTPTEGNEPRVLKHEHVESYVAAGWKVRPAMTAVCPECESAHGVKTVDGGQP